MSRPESVSLGSDRRGVGNLGAVDSRSIRACDDLNDTRDAKLSMGSSTCFRSGCPWRLVPHDLPAWGTVYYYFRLGETQGSGIRLWKPCVNRRGRSKGEMKSPVPL